MKDSRIQIRVTKEQKEVIQELADRDNRTLSNYLIDLALREYMKGDNKMGTDYTYQINYTYEELKAEADQHQEEMSIKTHPDGGKLALYDGKTIVDWADYSDEERIEGWKREYQITDK